MKNYILEGKNPVVEPDIVKWAAWFKDAERHVKHTKLPGGVHVSTVFLGMDHSFFGGPPILFETMIFGGEHDEYQQRYATWEEAEAGHDKAVNLVFEI